MFDLYVKSLLIGAMIETISRLIKRAALLDTCDLKYSSLNGYTLLPQPIRYFDDDGQIMKSLTELSLYLLPALYVVYSSDYHDMTPVSISDALTKEDAVLFETNGCEINVY